MKPIAIVLNGASSSGKTSIAQAIQRLSRTPVLHASLDSFTEMFCWSAISDPDIQRDCHRFGVSSFHACLPILASGRFSLVVDHVFEQHAWYEATREALKMMPIHFVGVRCALSVLEEREKKRADRRVGLARWQFDRVHERKVYDLEVDTESQTADACAAMILKTAEEKAANQSSQSNARNVSLQDAAPGTRRV